MTTIACYKGWLAADGRYTDENEILDDECQKIVGDREDGLITTGAGEGAPLELFMRGDWSPVPWISGGGPCLEPKILKQFKHCTGWIYRPGDKYLYQSNVGGFDPLPIKGPMQAIGTGAVYAKAAIRVLERHNDVLGLTPRAMLLQAIETAIECDLYSGGTIQIIKLK